MVALGDVFVFGDLCCDTTMLAIGQMSNVWICRQDIPFVDIYPGLLAREQW
jgi:hypothetical protein